jgi:hypothetical protein
MLRIRTVVDVALYYNFGVKFRNLKPIVAFRFKLKRYEAVYLAALRISFHLANSKCHRYRL